MGPSPDLGTESLRENTRTLHVDENERGRFFVALGIQLSRVLLGFAADGAAKSSGKDFKEWQL
jgi:hypothetical protein